MPVEVIPEPIVYEVAVPVKLVVDSMEAEAQTSEDLLPVRTVEVVKEIAPIEMQKQD